MCACRSEAWRWLENARVKYLQQCRIASHLAMYTINLPHPAQTKAIKSDWRAGGGQTQGSHTLRLLTASRVGVHLSLTHLSLAVLFLSYIIYLLSFFLTSTFSSSALSYLMYHLIPKWHISSIRFMPLHCSTSFRSKLIAYSFKLRLRISVFTLSHTGWVSGGLTRFIIRRGCVARDKKGSW